MKRLREDLLAGSVLLQIPGNDSFPRKVKTRWKKPYFAAAVDHHVFVCGCGLVPTPVPAGHPGEQFRFKQLAAVRYPAMRHRSIVPPGGHPPGHPKPVVVFAAFRAGPGCVRGGVRPVVLEKARLEFWQRLLQRGVYGDSLDHCCGRGGAVFTSPGLWRC